MKILISIVTVYYLYHLFFLLVGLPMTRKKTSEILNKSKHRFAILVPAHNEEKVIFSSVQSILKANYPREKFNVFVIADNCTDKTASLAVKSGAKALIRNDINQRGKQFALEWAFKQIDLNEFDAVIILDADNQIDSYFLNVLDEKLSLGHNVIQSYVETKNPCESWITMNYAYSMWYIHRISMARSRMGMSAWLAGTGVCLRTELLKRIGWNVNTLTDDIEYTCQLLLNGERVYMADDAIVYDQKPVSIKDSIRQRVRWIRGQTQVTINYLPKILSKVLKSWFKGNFGQSIRAFDALMWVPMQLIILISFSYSISTSAYNYLIAVLITTPLFYVLPLIAERINIKKAWLYIITSGIFFLTWIPITTYGVVTYGKQGWWRTPH